METFKNYYLSYNPRNMSCAIIPLMTVSPLQIINSFTIRITNTFRSGHLTVTAVGFQDTGTLDIWNLW